MAEVSERQRFGAVQQSVNRLEITAQEAQLPFFRPAAWLFFLGKGDKTAAGFDAIRSGTWLFTNQRHVPLVDDLVGFLPGFVEKTDVGRIANVGRRTSSVGDQLAPIGWQVRDIILRIGLLRAIRGRRLGIIVGWLFGRRGPFRRWELFWCISNCWR